MFSFIPPAILEIAQIQEHIKANPKKTTVIGHGDTVFTMFVFQADSATPNGYSIKCHNLRDPSIKINVNSLPAGFYSLIQSITGNFIVMRTGIGSSAHAGMLSRVGMLSPNGLSATQSKTKAAGEIFVGPNGKILLYNPSSGGYHPVTYANYVLKKEADHAKQLAAMNLPTACIIANYKIFSLETMLAVERKFYGNNGKWAPDSHAVKESASAVMASNALPAVKNVHIFPDRFFELDPISRYFIYDVIVCSVNYDADAQLLPSPEPLSAAPPTVISPRSLSNFQIEVKPSSDSGSNPGSLDSDLKQSADGSPLQPPVSPPKLSKLG